MNKRKLKDGSEVDSFDHPIDLIIHTKAPGKWLVVDLETGQEYIGADVPNKYGRWLRLKDKTNGDIG